MNCKEFEQVMCDLVRDRLMGESLRRRAISHVGTCSRCSRQLADERTLSAELRLLAGSMASEKPSPQVEAALLSAYRRSLLPHQALGAASYSRRFSRSRYWIALAGSAAAIFVVFLYSSYLAGLLPEGRTDRIEIAEGDRNDRPQSLTQVGARRGSGVTTNFIPVIPCQSSDCMDRGQLVRVVLPRSSLLYFGLPTNEGLLHEGVVADLLISEDGVARAIRFVQ